MYRFERFGVPNACAGALRRTSDLATSALAFVLSDCDAAHIVVVLSVEALRFGGTVVRKCVEDNEGRGRIDDLSAGGDEEVRGVCGAVRAGHLRARRVWERLATDG